MYRLKMTRAMLRVLIIFLVYFDLTISFYEEPKHYTVIPSPGDPCSDTEQCLTLSQFANNSSEYLGTNVMLHFVQGEHSLASTIQIENLNTFNMSSHDSNVTIVCNHFWTSARFELSNMSVVHISGLTFIGCTGNRFINIGQYVAKDSQFIGHKDLNGTATAAELVETSATFVRTEFSNNYGSRVISLYCENDGTDNYRDFLYSKYIYADIEVSVTAGGAISSTHSSVTIIDSVFEGNSAQAGGAIFTELQSNIIIINSTFVRNQATSLQSHQYCYAGGGVLYSDHSGGSSVVIQNSTFEHNTAHWLGGVMATGLHGNATITITNS